VRQWWADLVAGRNPAAPPEIVSKIRLLEGVLPIVGPLLGQRRVRSIADLLPADDAEASGLLALVHGWTGRMLTGSSSLEESTGVETQTGNPPPAELGREAPALPPSQGATS
jgi:hypothetical protein